MQWKPRQQVVERGLSPRAECWRRVTQWGIRARVRGRWVLGSLLSHLCELLHLMPTVTSGGAGVLLKALLLSPFYGWRVRHREEKWLDCGSVADNVLSVHFFPFWICDEDHIRKLIFMRFFIFQGVLMCGKDHLITFIFKSSVIKFRNE